jgi:hypothetical protein
VGLCDTFTTIPQRLGSYRLYKSRTGRCENKGIVFIFTRPFMTRLFASLLAGSCLALSLSVAAQTAAPAAPATPAMPAAAQPVTPAVAPAAAPAAPAAKAEPAAAPKAEKKTDKKAKKKKKKAKKSKA